MAKSTKNISPNWLDDLFDGKKVVSKKAQKKLQSIRKANERDNAKLNKTYLF